MDLMERQLEHDRWATRRLLELSRDLTDAQLDREFDIGRRTLRATFEHMIFNVTVWTRVMTGQPVEPQSGETPVAALIERHERSYDAFAGFARQMRDERRLDDAFVDAFGGRMTFSGAVIHLVLHDAEHRSEALHILERLGVPDLPELDHALWDQTARNA